MTDAGAQSPLSSTLSWAIVIQSLDESYRLEIVEAQDEKHGQQIWKAIQRHVLGSSTIRHMTTLLIRRFTKVVVGIGTLKEVRCLPQS